MTDLDVPPCRVNPSHLVVFTLGEHEFDDVFICQKCNSKWKRVQQNVEKDLPEFLVYELTKKVDGFKLK